MEFAHTYLQRQMHSCKGIRLSAKKKSLHLLCDFGLLPALLSTQNTNGRKKVCQRGNGVSKQKKKNASVLLQTGEFTCGKNSAVSQTRKEQQSREETKAILKKRKGGEELIVFCLCTMYPSPSLWTQGLCTCQHTCAHMFLVLRDRLRRKYRKTVSVCALGGGRE